MAWFVIKNRLSGLSYLNAEKPHLMEDTIRCGFSAVRNRTIRCGLTCPSIGIGYG